MHLSKRGWANNGLKGLKGSKLWAYLISLTGLMALAVACEQQDAPDSSEVTAASAKADQASSKASKTGEQNKEGEGKEQPPITVEVERVELVELFEPKVFGGFLKAIQQHPVHAPVAGTLEKLFVAPYSEVKKGQRLARIRPGALGESYRPYVLTAGAKGWLPDHDWEVGDFIGQYKTLFRLLDTSSFLLPVEVPVEELGLMEEDAVLPVEFTSNGEDSRENSGEKGRDELAGVMARVLRVSRQVDPKFGTVTVELRLSCQEQSSEGIASACRKQAKLGRFAKVTAKTGLRQGVRVAHSVLKSRGRKVLVYLRDKEEVQERKVELGRDYGRTVEVLEGLEPGDLMVTAYSRYPSPGQKVVLQSEQHDAQAQSQESKTGSNDHAGNNGANKNDASKNANENAKLKQAAKARSATQEGS